jgi:hypothetical protein
MYQIIFVQPVQFYSTKFELSVIHRTALFEFTFMFKLETSLIYNLQFFNCKNTNLLHHIYLHLELSAIDISFYMLVSILQTSSSAHTLSSSIQKIFYVSIISFLLSIPNSIFVQLIVFYHVEQKVNSEH